MAGHAHRPRETRAAVLPDVAEPDRGTTSSGGVGMAAIREQLAAGGGNAADVFGLGAQGAARPMPYRGALEAALGADLSGTQVFQGPAADAALGVLGARAAEHDGNMLLPSSGVSAELVGHEAVHVAQRQLGADAAVHAAGDVGSAGSASEREADELGSRAARGEPVSVREPPGGGVNLWDLGSAWNRVTDAVSSGASWVGDTASAAWDSASDTLSDGADWVGDAATGLWDGATDTVNAGVDWVSDTYDDLQHKHYDERMTLNGEHPEPGTLKDGEDGWTLLSPELSVLHDNRQDAPEEKWVNEDGREAVFDGGTDRSSSADDSIMTDDQYLATYNYAVPMELDEVDSLDTAWDWTKATAQHVAYDVAPWVLWGNTRDDPTEWHDRLRMLLTPAESSD